MFRRFAIATPVRLALCLAAFLTVGGSFGLHPEPLDAGIRTPGAQFAITDSQDPPHACLACLTHGMALVRPLLAVLPSASPSSMAPGLKISPACSRLAGLDLPGRSPPARS